MAHPLARAVALSSLLLAAACGGGTPGPEATLEGTEHVCSSCHGLQGRSVNPTFPNLAGQQKEYIEAQLKAFRDKTRADPHAHTYMWGMAARLSDETIAGLAAFYSSQTPAPGSEQNAGEVAAGKKIFQEGIAAKEVPACVACHGEKAEGNETIPRLAGQHRSYLEDQLGHFVTNARANEIMHENAKNMTPQEINEIAAYLAAQ
jgi:cytochrome c553